MKRAAESDIPYSSKTKVFSEKMWNSIPLLRRTIEKLKDQLGKTDKSVSSSLVNLSKLIRSPNMDLQPLRVKKQCSRFTGLHLPGSRVARSDSVIMISSGDESDETCIHDRKLIFQT
jgi:hypothetical protein